MAEDAGPAGRVRGLVGKVRAVGVVSAVAAVALWAVGFSTLVWPLSVKTLGALLALAVLLAPAAGTFLAVGTLREVLDLPSKIRSLPGSVRDAAAETAARASAAVAPAAGRGRSRRLAGFFGVLWRLRGIVQDTRGSWLRTLALARFARLASLPFAFGLVAAFALNFVVIAVAVAVLIGMAL